MNGADTAWIIVATALVLFMTLPGLALFYGGLVRARNVLSVFMHCYAIACLMSVLWLALGYSIAFGGGDSGYWGGLDKIFLLNVTSDSLSGTLPEILFFAFQMTFAIITPALIVGAYVERVGFAFVMAFSGLWMLLCYAPVVHWIWGGGMLSDGGILGVIGVKDFAGGIVVHETAGLAALVLAFFLGSRKNKTKPPHNPGYVMIGAAMLWVGWFGFNGGSVLATATVADATAVANVFMNTNAAAAGGCIAALTVAKVMFGKFDLTMALNGCLAGLVAITAEPSTPTALQATVFGVAGGVLVVLSIVGLDKLKFDDPVGAVSVHGVVGLLGLLLVPLTNDASSFSGQLLGAFTIFTWVFVTSFVVFKVIGLITPVRVSEEEEYEGSDLAECGLEAYPEFTSAR